MLRLSFVKKNSDVVVRVWGGEHYGTGLANQREEVFAFAAREDWSQFAGTFKAIGAGADRFWERAFLQACVGAGAGALRF